MKKPLTFGLVLAALAVLSALCRRWQRATAFEPDTGLLIPGMPATAAVVAVTVTAAAALLALSWWTVKGRSFRSYLDGFALPCRGLMCGHILAGALLAGAGAVGVWEHKVGLNSQLSAFVFSVVLIPTGMDLALVGWLGAQRRESEGRFAWPLLLPGYCGCIWLVAAFQALTSTPNTMSYGFYLLGAVLAATGCYLMASFSFEKPQPVGVLWTSSMALVLLAAALVDAAVAGRWERLLATAGYMLYLAVQLASLLYRTVRPAGLELWTPPAEEEPSPLEPDTNLDVEVTDHEQ